VASTKFFTSLFTEEMAADGMRSDKGPFGLGKTAFSLKYFNNAICIRITNEFPLIFGETIFVEVPKIHEIHEIYGP